MEKYQVKVLYVEDEEMVREPFVEMLLRRVQEVVVASNGQEGIELFHEQKPDIIITDIKMPVMDGLTMATLIRKENPYIPVMITTAFEFKDFLKKSIEVGINKYLVKPIERSAVENALAELVKVVEFQKANREYSDFVELMLDVNNRVIILADGSKINQVNTDFLSFFGFSDRGSFFYQYPTVMDFFRSLGKQTFHYHAESSSQWLDSFLKVNGIENNTFFNFSQNSGRTDYNLRFYLFRDQQHLAIILNAM